MKYSIDLKGLYEPGKRHWLKVKKDYLNEGAMADSADLVVLGAWHGKFTNRFVPFRNRASKAVLLTFSAVFMLI